MFSLFLAWFLKEPIGKKKKDNNFYETKTVNIKNKNINNVEKTVSAVGAAFAIILTKKLPLTLSLLGSRASIKEGAPIVIKFIKLKWIGIYG